MPLKLLNQAEKDELCESVNARLNRMKTLRETTGAFLERYKCARSLFLYINREFLDGPHITQFPRLAWTVQNRAAGLTRELTPDHGVSPSYRELCLKTLRKTREIYQDRIKLWYSCSLGEVPLEVNHIIISYLVQKN